MVIVWVLFCGLGCSSQDEGGSTESWALYWRAQEEQKSPAVAVVWKIGTETPCPNPRGGGGAPAPATLLLDVMGTEIWPSHSAKGWPQRWPGEEQFTLLPCVRTWVAGTMDIKGTGAVVTEGTETPTLFFLVLRRAKRWLWVWLWYTYIYFCSEGK